MAVLGLLKEQEMHGYELKKKLQDVFGFSSAVSFGSLYPALARLEAAGAVHVIDPAPAKGQAENALSPEGRAGRRRKVYAITPLGAKMFEDLLADSHASTEDDRSFSLRLAFASHLPPERRLGLLLQRRAILGQRLAQLVARARARREDRYMRVLFQRQQEELSSHVSWLDKLIRDEREPNESTETAQAADFTVGPGPAGAGSTYRGPSLRPPVLVPLASASQLRPTAPARLAAEPPGKPARQR
ncbi:MAG: PadR family transcriptional regulator [Acidimicrobiales bacterium]